MMASGRTLSSVVAVLVAAGLAWGQPQGGSPPPEPPPVAPPFTLLVDDLLGLFPKVQGEVLEVRDTTLTLDIGKKDGSRPGLELEVFREGREIRHPKTGALLGRAEESVGKVKVIETQEAFSLAAANNLKDVRPGDRFRSSADKVNLVLLPLQSAVRDSLVEAAIQELITRLSGSGRFRVTMGDTINVYLAEEGIKAEELLQGKGVAQAAQRFHAENLLALHFKRIQNKPYLEVRVFLQSRQDAVITTAFFVPSTIKPSPPGGRFSGGGGPANPPQAKPRSLLARLLGGDLEAGSYSSGESTIPLREVARFNFPVLALDVAVSPKDKIPRMAVSDGDQVYMYRIVNQKFEAEWSISVRSLGRVISLQLADLDGDGVFEVLGNRHDTKVGLNSFILTTRDGKPRFLADDISEFLFAVDLKGDGVKQTLWTQRYSPGTFFTPGQADQVVVKNGKLVVEKPVQVPAGFRPMGAAFANVMGKNVRSLAFIDAQNRLQISNEGEELWRSATSVGGGYMQVEHDYTWSSRTARSKLYKIEPTPLAIDLDGDGIDEILVPQNLVREGLLAVVFKGPAGFRLQSVNTGFEGGITALGGYRTDDSTQPTVIAAVVRFNSLLKMSGETQIIMTVPQE